MTLRTGQSRALFTRAQHVIPGGVNSPVRAFRAVGGEPLFIARASGAHLWDADGNKLIDHVGSWGPMILGHAHPRVVAVVTEQTALGTSYGAPTRLEVEMAEAIHRIMPSMELVRMVSSGTEAAMSAARLARGVTGRPKIVKFEGCYHGHADSFLIKAGSGAATFGQPDSPGVTEGVAQDTLIADYNSLDSVDALFDAYPGQIAAIIVEPVAGNMGVVPPRPGFLAGLREICDEADAILIYDEVMTGFRVARGGARQKYAIRPDLTLLGKIVGGGLPAAAYGGRGDLMESVAPTGPVYQAGTLSGNPLAMAAGLATLRTIEEDPGIYDRLEARGAALEKGLNQAIARHGAPCSVARVGSMWTLFFTPGPVTDWKSAAASDTAMFGRWFHALLGAGIYVAPSQFEANFLSDAHTDADIEATLAAADAALEAAVAA
jgi:glutamate-1-semialdehyde 2,1-aminomutase